MKKFLLMAIVITFPMLRAVIMHDTLFFLIFQSFNLGYSWFFLSLARSENLLSLVAIPLIWMSFYLPFFVIFPKGKRLDILQIVAKSLSFTAIIGFVDFIIILEVLFGMLPDSLIFFIYLFAFISIPVFIVETVIVAWNIDGFKDIGFLKSLCVSVLSFLIFPFLLIFGVQMVFGGR